MEFPFILVKQPLGVIFAGQLRYYMVLLGRVFVAVMKISLHIFLSQTIADVARLEPTELHRQYSTTTCAHSIDLKADDTVQRQLCVVLTPEFRLSSFVPCLMLFRHRKQNSVTVFSFPPLSALKNAHVCHVSFPA